MKIWTCIQDAYDIGQEKIIDLCRATRRSIRAVAHLVFSIPPRPRINKARIYATAKGIKSVTSGCASWRWKVLK